MNTSTSEGHASACRILRSVSVDDGAKWSPGSRVCCGITVEPNKYSAPWRRQWWITDIGIHNAAVRLALIESAGVDPEDVATWQPNVSFKSLTAACAAIAKATGSAA